MLYPEAVALAKRLNGAAHAIAFGPVARSDRPGSSPSRLPAFGAHVDYGRRTIEDIARPILGARADYWLAKRRGADEPMASDQHRLSHSPRTV